MKKILALIAIVTVYSNVYAQDTKWMVEFGGSYSKNKHNSDIENTSLQQLANSKNSNININLGYKTTKNSYLGITFKQVNRESEIKSKSLSILNIIYINTDLISKSNNYGLFYRIYLLPIDNSRWNAYAELTSSIQNVNTSHVNQYIIKSLPNVNITSNIIIQNKDTDVEEKYKSWDNNIRLGGSYLLSDKLLLQLSLHSVGNINYQPNNYSNEIENNKIAYKFFESPLANINLSLIFKI